MKFRDRPEDAQRRLETLVEEMGGESDRAVAIVGAAWVEEALGDSIKSFLIIHVDAHNRLFSGAGPLSSFSAKIDLARLLGLMTDPIRSDLHKIREIRNEFAHSIAHKQDHTKLSFASGHIRDRCMAFNCVAQEGHGDPRVAFTRACATLNADFDWITLIGDKISGQEMVVGANVDAA
jgi:hypothetical protein